MITSHHSFSTRIFLKETPAVHASTVLPAAEQPENLREFWWFLRGSQSNPPANNRDTQRAMPPAKIEKRHA